MGRHSAGPATTSDAGDTGRRSSTTAAVATGRGHSRASGPTRRRQASAQARRRPSPVGRHRAGRPRRPRMTGPVRRRARSRDRRSTDDRSAADRAAGATAGATARAPDHTPTDAAAPMPSARRRRRPAGRVQARLGPGDRRRHRRSAARRTGTTAAGPVALAASRTSATGCRARGDVRARSWPPCRPSSTPRVLYLIGGGSTVLADLGLGPAGHAPACVVGQLLDAGHRRYARAPPTADQGICKPFGNRAVGVEVLDDRRARRCVGGALRRAEGVRRAAPAGRSTRRSAGRVLHPRRDRLGAVVAVKWCGLTSVKVTRGMTPSRPSAIGSACREIWLPMQ